MFVADLDVCGLAKLPARAAAVSDVMWTELVNAVYSFSSHLLFMALVF